MKIEVLEKQLQQWLDNRNGYYEKVFCVYFTKTDQVEFYLKKKYISYNDVNYYVNVPLSLKHNRKIFILEVGYF